MNSPARTDQGGIWAIAGFLYQLVGILSLTTWIAEPPTGSDTHDPDEALLLLQDMGKKAKFFNELYDDASILDEDDDAIIFQFKYSTTNRTLTEPEIKEIVGNLRQAARAASDGGVRVTACILATNRTLTEPAQTTWAKEQSAFGLEQPLDLKHLPLSLGDAKEQLIAFAKQHGVLKSEIESGIKQLVGKLAVETGQQFPGRSISRKDLIEAFTNSEDSRPITPEAARAALESKLRLHRNRDKGLQHTLVRRQQILDDLATLSLSHAVIVLHGDGGCGKSVSLVHWIEEQGFADFRVLEDVKESWLAEAVCSWANIKTTDHPWRRERLDKSLERVESANSLSSSTPIVHLAIDGMDEEAEAGTSRGLIRPVLDFFFDLEDKARMANEPPRAVLVVSCRSLDDFKEKSWRTISGQGNTIDIGAIRVQEFSSQELLRMVESSSELSADVSATLASVLANEDDLDIQVAGRPRVLGDRSLRFTTSADMSIVRAIRHPNTFGCFLQLEHNIQMGVLTGSKSELEALAEAVVDRFCRKAQDRGGLDGLDLDEIKEVLAQIAKATPIEQTLREKREWIETATKTGLLEYAKQAGRLYKEAISGGLIIMESYRWQWHQEWVHDYLASRAGT